MSGFFPARRARVAVATPALQNSAPVVSAIQALYACFWKRNRITLNSGFRKGFLGRGGGRAVASRVWQALRTARLHRERSWSSPLPTRPFGFPKDWSGADKTDGQNRGLGERIRA